MTGAIAVVALIMLEWASGMVVVAGWTQSWKVVSRGHFRIVAWCGLALGIAAVAATRSAVGSSELDEGLTRLLVMVAIGGAGLYLAAQYLRSDVVGTVIGYIAGALGALALFEAGSLIDVWSQGEAALTMIAGALLLGSVTNGMLLGHWYLNQPGLKPWALARLTALGLFSVALSAVIGLVFVTKLAGADPEGLLLGLPTTGSTGGILFGAWIVILGFTGVIVYLARRCVNIRSIQSATGLYYVALLGAGVSEFLVRYLMLNA